MELCFETRSRQIACIAPAHLGAAKYRCRNASTPGRLLGRPRHLCRHRGSWLASNRWRILDVVAFLASVYFKPIVHFFFPRQPEYTPLCVECGKHWLLGYDPLVSEAPNHQAGRKEALKIEQKKKS